MKNLSRIQRKFMERQRKEKREEIFIPHEKFFFAQNRKNPSDRQTTGDFH